MANRLGEIMEELERHDYYAGDGQDRVPSWIRASSSAPARTPPPFTPRCGS